jgi:hypothetical protein
MRSASSPSSLTQRRIPAFEMTSSRKPVTTWTMRSGPLSFTRASTRSSVFEASDQITSTSSCSREPTQR